MEREQGKEWGEMDYHGQSLGGRRAQTSSMGVAGTKWRVLDRKHGGKRKEMRLGM